MKIPELSVFTHRLLIGGNSIEEDLKALRENGGNIIICTPGRFEDLLQRRTDFNLSMHLKNLVSPIRFIE